MKRDFYSSIRVLFILNSCSHCREYAKFIETLNMKLPMDKKIKVVNVTNYYDFGIIDDPLIMVFKKYLEGGFPVLFFDSMRLDGSRNVEELKRFMYTLVFDELIIRDRNDYEYVKYMYNKNCKFVDKRIFGGNLVCDD